MKWIELETVLEIHYKIIKATGGTYGTRDKGMFVSHNEMSRGVPCL